MLRVLWNSCQPSLLSLLTRCPACLQSPTLLLGLLASLFCPELLSASCGSEKRQAIRFFQAQRKGEGNSIYRVPTSCRHFICVLPHLILQALQYCYAHLLIRRLRLTKAGAGRGGPQLCLLTTQLHSSCDPFHMHRGTAPHTHGMQ